MSYFAARDSGDGSGPRPKRPLFHDDPETIAQIKALEAEIADLHAQQKQCEQETKELARREMAGEGPFAAQIHALKQRKMVLATEAQHRKVCINALRMNF
jgi:hypothetical protein